MAATVRGFNRERLAELRVEGGLSREELGRRSEVSPSVLSRWESGEKGPSPESLARVARALGVVSADLIRIPPDERTLADLRELAGYSQVSLAKELEWTPDYLGKIEKGADLDDARAQHLAHFLRTDTETVLAAHDRVVVQALQERLNRAARRRAAAAAS